MNISRENELQNIVTLAAETCQAAAAVLVILDQGKLIAKYKAGIVAEQVTSRNIFSYIQLPPGQVTVIPDTLRDQRTAYDVLVTGPAGIRFYAGIPLITHDNDQLGALYVLDGESKTLSPRRKGMLRILAQQAVNMVEFDTSLHILKEQFIDAKNSENKLRSFFESSKSNHLLIGRHMDVITYNKAFFETIYQLMHIRVEPGINVMECIPPNYLDDFISHFQNALAGKSIQHDRILQFKDGPPIWTRISYNPAYDEEGKIIGVSFNASDITHRKISEQRILEQNEALRKIAYMQSHELRKPVATILGLMNLIKMQGYGDNEELLVMMEKTVSDLDSSIRQIVTMTETQPRVQDVLKENYYNQDDIDMDW
ncbi:PAS domain S-box protein [Mucilaginibacter sp. Bleaf8]|nr:PAS domain S-box protein [Mucilaginibacter sp. Bleaf8]